MLHSISGLACRMAFLQTFRNTQKVLQFTVIATGKTRLNSPKRSPYQFLLRKCKSTGGSYFEKTTGTGSA